MTVGLRAVAGVVLVGGLGTRMRSLTTNVPKPMLPVAGHPFLEHVLRYLAAAGLRRVVLAVGYRSEAVMRYFGDGARVGLELVYADEEEPLGTGGAIRQACGATGGWPVLVLNGDSFVALDVGAMLGAHVARRARITMALAEVRDAGRFGRVRLGSDGTIVGFDEKTASGPGLVNAGVYLLEEEVVASIPAGRSSFERDTLTRLHGKGTLGFTTRGYFVDIGVPEDYQRLVTDPRAFVDATAGTPR
jgi:NDP-sugar pyrophosphorylase family protein